MVRHIIMFKLKDFSNEVEKENSIRILKNELLTLKEKISFIQYIEVGVNKVNLPFAYDLVLITDFNNFKELDNYRIHPDHLKFIEFNKSYSVSKVSVDYLV
jgi:hypothetical protein